MKLVNVFFSLLIAYGVFVVLGSVGYSESNFTELSFVVKRVFWGILCMLLGIGGKYFTIYLKWVVSYRKKLKIEKYKRKMLY